MSIQSKCYQIHKKEILLKKLFTAKLINANKIVAENLVYIHLFFFALELFMEILQLEHILKIFFEFIFLIFFIRKFPKQIMKEIFKLRLIKRKTVFTCSFFYLGHIVFELVIKSLSVFFEESIRIVIYLSWNFSFSVASNWEYSLMLVFNMSVQSWI